MPLDRKKAVGLMAHDFEDFGNLVSIRGTRQAVTLIIRTCFFDFVWSVSLNTFKIIMNFQSHRFYLFK